MDTNAHESEKLLHKDLVYEIVGAAIEVLKEIGHGLHEKPYEDALVIELGIKNHGTSQQERFPITYKGHHIADYVPDLVVDDAVVVDAKVIDRITDHERGQMLNYLRITRLRVGLILNFKRARLEWERIVL
jgi:GxxExxY protein